MRSDELVVTVRDDGSVVADHFPMRFRISMHLLDRVDPSLMAREGDLLTLIFANGTHTYRLGEPVDGGFSDVRWAERMT